MSFIAYHLINRGSFQIHNTVRPEIQPTRLQSYQHYLRLLRRQRQRLIELERRLGLDN